MPAIQIVGIMCIYEWLGACTETDLTNPVP